MDERQPDPTAAARWQVEHKKLASNNWLFSGDGTVAIEGAQVVLRSAAGAQQRIPLDEVRSVELKTGWIQLRHWTVSTNMLFAFKSARPAENWSIVRAIKSRIGTEACPSCGEVGKPEAGRCARCGHDLARQRQITGLGKLGSGLSLLLFGPLLVLFGPEHLLLGYVAAVALVLGFALTLKGVAELVRGIRRS